MAGSAPDGVVLRRDRDLAGRAWQIWVRRGLFAVPLAVLVLALLDVFGQRPSTVSASGGGVSLAVDGPTRLRGGLLASARIAIRTTRRIGDARVLLASGWVDGITVNNVSPSPSQETSVDGRLLLDLGRIRAGGRYDLYIPFQVNPTTVGRRAAGVELLDGARTLLHVDRTVVVYP